MKLRASLVQQIVDVDQRVSERHASRIALSIVADGQGEKATITDLSPSGLQLVTDAAFEVGSELEIELLESQNFWARIVWKENEKYGCEFVRSVPASVIWNVLLKASFEVDPAQPPAAIKETVVGSSDDPARIAQWYSDFERRGAQTGEELLGFRKDGHQIVAILAKARPRQH